MKRQDYIPRCSVEPALCAVVCLAALIVLGAPPTHAAVTEAWVQTYDGPAHREDYAQAMVMDRLGNVIVTGSSRTGGEVDYSQFSDYFDFYTAKYAAKDGTLLWERSYNGPGNSHDRARAVAVDSRGNVVVTGYSEDVGGMGGFYTAKYAARDGALLWERRQNAPANRDFGPRALVVDSRGNVVATGSAGGSGDIDSADYYTAKYSGKDGRLLWEHRYNDPLNGYDGAYALALDNRDNVVVTGYSVSDAYTAKYAAKDGTLLWENRKANGFAAAVAVDGRGNVVVASRVPGSGGADYHTARYAAADGALLWEQRFNGPANASDYPYAVGVDRQGNVVVTGFSESSRDPVNYTDLDFYTAKYAAADGSLLWEQRYAGPRNQDDFGRSLAVDGRGNVVVMGYSQGDFYTTKYAAENGTLIWEQRFNDNGERGANWHTGGYALDLAPSGAVAIAGSSIDRLGSIDFTTVVYRPKKSRKDPIKRKYEGNDSKQP